MAVARAGAWGVIGIEWNGDGTVIGAWDGTVVGGAWDGTDSGSNGGDGVE